jgi:sulfite dehydrogenase (quinone) subunit SoeC
MHPAYSVIFFTVASGAGYGLAACLGLGVLDPGLASTKIAHVLALALISAGLVSSTFHLGNPQRAWRAFSQWRSSWLSREGVMAMIAFVPLVLSAANAIFRDAYSPSLGILATVACIFTVYCTAMIYASLRTVHAWHTWHTPLCYLLFSAASGLALLSVFAMAAGGSGPLMPLAAIVLLCLAWLEKGAWRRNAARPGSSTPESATGLGSLGKVRLLEAPHMTPNYLTREMGYRVARKHAGKLWRIAMLLGLALPVVLLFLAMLAHGPAVAVASALAGLGAISILAGLLVERWLFFAEAKHAVSNYYGI